MVCLLFFSRSDVSANPPFAIGTPTRPWHEQCRLALIGHPTRICAPREPPSRIVSNGRVEGSSAPRVEARPFPVAKSRPLSDVFPRKPSTMFVVAAPARVPSGRSATRSRARR